MPDEFTAKERDQESGLDYFGARYYGSALGRFTSPDWSANPQPVPYAVLGDPQSLNLYSYGQNNPVARADADGHCPDDGGTHGWVWCFFFAKPSEAEVAAAVKQQRDFAAMMKAAREAESQRPAKLTPQQRFEESWNNVGMMMAGTFIGEGVAGEGMELGTPNGSLTAAEQAEIQVIANKYNTTIDVVGSRAAGTGRNVETDLPVGKGANGRSDIDFRIDASHPQVKDLINDLKKVGGGAGSASTKYSTTTRPTAPPLIRFTPKQ